LRGNWQLFTGLSYGYNSTKTGINVDDDESSENASHMKLKLRKNFSDRFKLSVGADYFITKFNEDFRDDDGPDFNVGYDANIAAAFTEADIFFSKKFAAKAGIRLSNNSLLQETVLSPRVSLAYKISKRGQFSFAYGEFSEAPKVDYLKFSDFHRFDSERASHYILNYQYSRERQTLRAEAYLKDYRDLVKFSGTGTDTEFNNTGSGYAQGIDLFWRDGKSVKNLEYWISYSYIDTQRDYRDFPEMATPGFVASHSLSVVTKYWINEWRSQVGFTNSFSSGRPYTNPNEGGFLADKTRTYNSLSFNWAYLLSAQKILYFSVSNVLGYENVFGYEYADMAGTNGKYDRMPITPTADRFFFVGFFWTISDDKKSNQLDNL
jgi:hypothetical protein